MFSLLNIHNTVPCDGDAQFKCSDVECISQDQVCDGHLDCVDAADEFCHRDSGKEKCFLCADGTCISPSLPIYHPNYGKRYWWLCDNQAHCKDETDERLGKTDQRNIVKCYYSCVFGKRNYRVLVRVSVCVCVCVCVCVFAR